MVAPVSVNYHYALLNQWISKQLFILLSIESVINSINRYAESVVNVVHYNG